jgi:ribosomal protein S1
MVNQKQSTLDIGFTHDDFAALLDKYDYHFSPGDVVAGTVFSIEPRGALIDIGAKTAAYIPNKPSASRQLGIINQKGRYERQQRLQTTKNQDRLLRHQ